MKKILKILGKFYLVICILIVFNVVGRVLQVKEEKRYIYYTDNITMLQNELKALNNKINDLKEKLEM